MFCRRFGTKCAGCLQGISPNDLVRKARSKVFHLNCFTCMVCNKQLSTGEELYVIDENKFVCKEDFQSSGAIKEANLNSGKKTVARWRLQYFREGLIWGAVFFYLNEKKKRIKPYLFLQDSGFVVACPRQVIISKLMYVPLSRLRYYLKNVFFLFLFSKINV